MLNALAEFLLTKAFSSLVRRGSLSVELPSGRRLEFGDKTEPRASLRFADDKAVLALMLDPDLQLGELFMNDRLRVTEGTAYDVLTLLLRDSKAVQPGVLVRVLNSIRMSIRHFLQRNLPTQSRANVAHHYDLDDRLYDLFLDADRQYSCAYFEQPDDTLEEAQLAKKRHIAAKLLLEPGQRVLDIGCGWGGMALYLATVAGASQVTGVTLSEEQLAVANNRAEKAGLQNKIAFRLEDYRSTTGPFDRIVSVGMFEHVGLGFHDAFFTQCRKILTDDGVMLLHFIGNSDVPDFNNPWIEKYIFPGGHLPSLSECTPAIERSGLIVTDIEILRLHYAQTLRIWRERFMARREEAKALYDERFCKMWEFYLSMSEAAFRYQDIAIFQIQLAKRQENVPLTRDYMEGRKAELRQRERL
jgi:cyclopropane-fatty-acyl-phospholipid synthase